MGLNKAGGEMYPWADWTWDPLGGKCPHDCSYCYMKSWPFCLSEKYRGPLRIWEKEMRVNLSNLALNRREALEFVGSNPVIFVCSGNDLAKATFEAKKRILLKCQEEPRNFYLIQSKDPAELKEVEQFFPPNEILGTTLETNRDDLCRMVSNAPPPSVRVKGMLLYQGCRTMISVEPKLKCDPQLFADLIKTVGPDFVSVGADSKKHGLPEPTAEEVLEFISLLKEFTAIKKKSNLDRLLKAGEARKTCLNSGHKNTL